MINEQLIKAFGLRIKQLRIKKDLSQEKLSFASSFHRTYIGMIDRGERYISFTNMAVFAKVFEITVSELLDFSSIDHSQIYTNYQIKTEK